MLTAEQIATFRDQGYLLVPGLVPTENCRAVLAAMFEFLNMSPDRPDDWYRPPLRPRSGGMVELYHHPSEWANRQLPQVYELFRDLYGEHDLAVNIDRVSMKLPESPAHPEWVDEGFVHLDADPHDSHWARYLGIQGVLYLADTDESMGGFRCVPGFHKKLKAWSLLPKETRPAEPPAFTVDDAIYIPGKAGDFVVWDYFLPHGNGRNRSTRPRFAQYISMSVISRLSATDRARRLRLWQESLPAFGTPEAQKISAGPPAELTPLGRKLVLADPW